MKGLTLQTSNAVSFRVVSGTGHILKPAGNVTKLQQSNPLNYIHVRIAINDESNMADFKGILGVSVSVPTLIA